MDQEKVLARALTFDDVVLIPGLASVPADQVDLKTKVTKKIELKIPLLSAAMDTVTGWEMAKEMATLGGLGVIHRNLSVEEQAGEVAKVKAAGEDLLVAAAIGTSGDFLERTDMLVAAGVSVIVIDLAHGATTWAASAVKAIKERFPDLEIIAGNVATREGAEFLLAAGVDGLKVGIGGGSICTTRIITGVGVPNITAITEVKKALAGTGVPLIIDGGLRYSGDLGKALAAGADCGMMGGVLAGTNEAPGETVEKEDGLTYKTYRGMSVQEAMNNRTRDRYYQEEPSAEKTEKVHTSQGVSGLVLSKGPVKTVVEIFLGGVRSGLENAGAKDIAELQEKGRFYQVSVAGSKEGHAHDIKIAHPEKNYSA
jgi:IMP dehydrogenase